MTRINKHSEVPSLWIEYKDGIKFYILKKVKDKNVADDLSQDVLMKVYNSCCSGNEIKNVRSWLFQIAHNTTIDFFKKQSKISNELPEIPFEEDDSVYQNAEILVKPLINLLPKKYAIPLKLSDIDELKQIEVAQKLNLSLTATKSRIQRARKLLKDKIIECSNLETNQTKGLASLEIKDDCVPLNSYLKKNK